jgi:hypothetical protein
MMHVRAYRAARETAKLSSGTWKRGDLTVATDVQDDRKGRLDAAHRSISDFQNLT